MDFDKLREIAAAFNREGVEYILVGGGAVNLHGLVRNTEDVDFFVRPVHDNIERVKTALRSVWDDPSIEEIDADDVCENFPTVRYGPPDVNYYVDLMTGVGEMFRWEDLDSEIHDSEGVPVRIATPHTLIRMKRDTVRPKDRIDADSLRRKFGIEDT
ncbi:MAG TPA: hypothetical protein VF698_14005 [Thermoanaerobaculia bacterium]